MGIALCLSRNLRPRVEKLFSDNFPANISDTKCVQSKEICALFEALLWQKLCERRDQSFPRPCSEIRPLFRSLPTVSDEYKIFSSRCSRLLIQHLASWFLIIDCHLLSPPPRRPLCVVFKSRFPPHQLCCSSSDNCLIVRNGDEEDEERMAEKSFFILDFWFEGCRSRVECRDEFDTDTKFTDKRWWRHRFSRGMA